MAYGHTTASSGMPPPLTDHETLARAVTDRTEANFAKRNKSNPKATSYILADSFVHYEKNEVSVDRYDRMTTEDAVEHGEEMARDRDPNRQFRGWAVLTCADVTSIGFDAKASPEGGHFWHADILLPDDAATDEEAHNHYAAALANVATWLERPL